MDVQKLNVLKKRVILVIYTVEPSVSDFLLTGGGRLREFRP